VISTYNSGTGVWTASGAIADVNMLLAGVTYTPAVDYNSSFTIATSVDDGAAIPLTGVKDVSGTAQNDAPTAINLSQSTVNETTDTSAGYTIGTLSTTDPDTGDTATYTIVGGADAGVFSIGGAGADALILTDGVLDRETQASYVVTIRVTDSGGLSHDATFTITVNDLNENPSITTGNTFVVAENTNAVTTVNATDADQPAQTLTYTITGGTDAPRFALDSASGTLTFNTAPNFESPVDANSDNVYQVEVTVADGNGGTASQTLQVTIVNAAEAPSMADHTFSVDANGGVGTLIGTLTATDADTGDSLTFALIGSNSDGTFALDTNGQLTVADPTALPIGAMEPFLLTVQVTDSTGLSATATVTVQLLPTVEEAPVLEPETPSLSEPDASLPVPSVPPATSTGQSQTVASHNTGTPAGSGPPTGPSVPPSPAADVPTAPEEPGPSEPSLADAQDGDDDTDGDAQEGDASAVAASDRRDTNVLKASTRAELAAAKLRAFVPVELGSLLMVGEFMQELDKMRDEIREEASLAKTVVGSTLAATTGLSIGYVLWLIRGGMLLSSVLSSLPAWRLVDPLPILASLDKEADDEHTDDESLESIIGKRHKNSSQDKHA
jgi:hypothetical protein